MSLPEVKAIEPATYDIEHAAISDLGMRRANNQDAVVAHVAERADWVSRGHFFMVADGMGAHAAGELASKLAVDNVPHTYHKLPSLTPPAALRQAVHKANKLIYEKGQSANEFAGMGTTCSCLVLLPTAALVAHVGDSRVYRLRCGSMEQLTFDHSLVWEMAAASDTPDENVPACIPKNVITRSLGPHPMVNVDLEGPYEICAGDKFLLCSDGLTTVVDNQLIASLVDCLPPGEAAETLVDVANLRGGPDNISVVVVEITSKSASAGTGNGHPDGGQLSADRRSWWHRIFGWMCGEEGPAAAPHDLGGPYGNGPYRHYASSPVVSASDMAALCRELQSLESAPQSPLANQASIDWQAFHDDCEVAQTAARENEPKAAMAAYAAAIRRLMGEVRRGTAAGETRDSNCI